MHDEALGLDFWQEPVAVDVEVGFRISADIAEDVLGKLKAAGLETVEAIQNLQEAIEYQVQCDRQTDRQTERNEDRQTNGRTDG